MKNKQFIFICLGIVLAAWGPISSVKGQMSYRPTYQAFEANWFQDSAATAEKKKWYKTRAFNIAITPTVLFAFSLGTYNENNAISREGIREFRNRFFPTFNDHFDDIAQFVPIASYYVLNAFGVQGKHSVARFTATAASSYAMMAVLVNVMKYSIGETRPDGSANNSYPSGHTATAFVGAHLFAKEYGHKSPLYSIGSYSFGIIVGVFRQLNNRHWIADVLAGAAIGILSVDLSYLIMEGVFKDKGVNPPPDRSWFDRPMTKPSFIRFKSGYAYALGDFKNDPENIFPDDGFSLGAEGAYFFNPYFGVGGEASIVTFPVNVDNYNLPPEYQEFTEKVVYDAVGTFSYMFGPYLRVPISDKWSFGSKFVLGNGKGAEGAVKLKLKPEVSEEVGLNEVPVLTYRQAEAFTFAPGADIQFLASRNIRVNLFGEYHYLRPDYAVFRVTDINPMDGPVSDTSYNGVWSHLPMA